MAEKRKNKKKSFILSFCIVALCAWFAISLFSMVGDISKAKNEITEVKSATEAQNLKNKELREVNSQLENGDIDEYVEIIAREDGYVMPGERVYYDVSVNN